jgi:glutaminase
MDLPSISEHADHPYVSTGHLPEPGMVQRLVSDAHQRFMSNIPMHAPAGSTTLEPRKIT